MSGLRFLIEAIKRGIPVKEIPVTVPKRLHGHSKKPAVVRYGLGSSNTIVRNLAALASGAILGPLEEPLEVLAVL